LPINGSTKDAIAADPDFVRAQQVVVADKSIQFDFPKPDPPVKPPEWFKMLADFFDWASPVFKFLFWGAVFALVALLVWTLVRNMTGASFRWTWRKKTEDTTDDVWQPDAAKARVSLEEAEALAAQGRYAEAARLLLRHSVDDIADRRPGFLKPSITAREIATASEVPTTARTAFGAIARVVEASAFGSALVSAKAWEDCRAAYGDFALAGAWRG
jgi:hypothetical protein